MLTLLNFINELSVLVANAMLQLLLVHLDLRVEIVLELLLLTHHHLLLYSQVAFKILFLPLSFNLLQ